jgi:hypothetical protein
MEWYKLLPAELLKHTQNLSSGEMGWSRDEALRVIKFLEENKYTIGSVEVWAAGDVRPKISSALIYNWNLGLSAQENNGAHTAAEFVSMFQWHPDDKLFGNDKPLFSIYAVVSK